MTRKNKIKNIIGALLIVLLIVLIPSAGRVYVIHHAIKPTAWHIREFMDAYIQASRGYFPASEKDLETKGFLKKTETTDGFKYSVRYEPEDEKQRWQTFPNFGSFNISYGANTDNIEMIDGKLYDKSTHEQILLIDGPHKKYLKPTFEEISLHWYKLMLQEKQRTDSLQEPANSTK